MQTNLYVIVSKAEFDAKWKDKAEGSREKLDGTEVMFDAKFTGAEIKQLIAEGKDIYNIDEAPLAIQNPEWQVPAPIIVTIDAQFKTDYAAISGTANKLDFLETRLGLK